ncbi:hypothetical protein E8E13_001670 [Curvularia kusanoi]|uniref:Peptide hydrolase n=1 Tax=Curvularia kusanoi TaxID=90978 RepID=A0A9P4T8R5_CURKU|nr:hypothetical protein E8E13_001670 [Curvularia kusanoi]
MRYILCVAACIASVAAYATALCPSRPACASVACFQEWSWCHYRAQKPTIPNGVPGDLSRKHTLGPRADSQIRNAVQYPKKVAQHRTVTDLSRSIDPFNIWYDVQTLSNFTNRCFQPVYTSEGPLARQWLENRLSLLKVATKTDRSVEAWRQRTVVATIPGRSNRTIVVGAHYDSCIDKDSSTWRPIIVPGADDNASGAMTILEALRVLLQNEEIATGKANYTIEFHWYASRFGHQDGSDLLFERYSTQEKRDIAAVLNQDQTGYTGDLSDDEEPAFGLITDYTDKNLTRFVSLIIDEYTATPAKLILCGSVCSDHVSATKAGYPSAYVRESPRIYDFSTKLESDTIGPLNVTHMVEHAKLVVGFVVELAFADLG